MRDTWLEVLYNSTKFPYTALPLSLSHSQSSTIEIFLVVKHYTLNLDVLALACSYLKMWMSMYPLTTMTKTVRWFRKQQKVQNITYALTHSMRKASCFIFLSLFLAHFSTHGSLSRQKEPINIALIKGERKRASLKNYCHSYKECVLLGICKH